MGCFADTPSEYFQDRSIAAHHLTPEDQEALQLEALQVRFADLRDAIAPLKAMADFAKVSRIDSLDDVVPLLFPHGIYKSFPQHLLHKQRFDALGEWLGRLSINRLDALAGRRFDSMDGWLDAADAESDFDIAHSSGTTGALSLYPRGKDETKRLTDMFPVVKGEWVNAMSFGQSQQNYAVIWPSYASGRSATLKAAAVFRDAVASDPSLFFPLVPAHMSTDWQIYMLMIDDCRKRQAPPPLPSAYVTAKIKEAEDLHRTHDDRVRFILDTIRSSLGSTPVVFAGGPLALFSVASAGLKMGMSPAFAPGSIVRSFGGLKGQPEPERMQDMILEFAGVKRIGFAYGMTEVLTQFNACAAGRYHIPPWVIPYLVDPKTGKLMPRGGKKRGRAAFMDLLPRTYWGGVVSADIIEVDWQTCKCGRTTPHVGSDVARDAGAGEGLYDLSPVPAEAIDVALHAINRDIG